MWTVARLYCIKKLSRLRYKQKEEECLSCSGIYTHTCTYRELANLEISGLRGIHTYSKCNGRSCNFTLFQYIISLHDIAPLVRPEQ